MLDLKSQLKMVIFRLRTFAAESDLKPAQSFHLSRVNLVYHVEKPPITAICPLPLPYVSMQFYKILWEIYKILLKSCKFPVKLRYVCPNKVRGLIAEGSFSMVHRRQFRILVFCHVYREDNTARSYLVMTKGTSCET